MEFLEYTKNLNVWKKQLLSDQYWDIELKKVSHKTKGLDRNNSI